MIILLIILFFIFGAPLFTIIGAFAITGFSSIETSSAAIIIELYRLASQPVLIAIPLFTFAGYLLAESNAPKRILNFSQALLGWLPGGVSIVVLMVCALFTAFTGGSGITIIALGGLVYPILLSEKFSEKFSLGLVTTTGSLGLLFAPSLPLIVYGIVAEVSIDKLFLAGIVPGIILIFSISIYSFFQAGESNVSKHHFSFKILFDATKQILWELPLPFLILFGIYFGWFTTMEAASITAVYVFIVEVLILKDVKFKTDLPKIINESMVMVGAILMILATAMGLTSFLIDEQVPQKLFELVSKYISDEWVFLIVLNIFLIIVGMMMDIFSALIVVVPLIIPISAQYNIDPVHLGIIFILNLEIGYLTPPVGLNLFLSSFRFKKSIGTITKSVIPFIVILIICLILITFIPELSIGIFKFVNLNL